MAAGLECSELLTVGDELLRGDVVNGNAAWLGARLFECGVPVQRVVAVADEAGAIVSAVHEAAARCRLLVITGGLGPTVDDLTVAALAQAIGEPLIRRPELVERDRAALRRDGPALLQQQRQTGGAAALGHRAGE
ncbi:MAG: hypothetical protein IPG96_18865 [Proteobacteria bacterium]|nr:hypothetical protein [Pseudomonadota bacterium]